MRVKKFEFGYLMVLEKGDIIEECFFEFAKQFSPPSCFIFGMGSLTNLKIGFYDSENDDFLEKEINTNLEMTSFIGNLTYQHDIPIIHAHITATDKNFNMLGGHFISATINVSGEFYLIIGTKKILRSIPADKNIPLINDEID